MNDAHEIMSYIKNNPIAVLSTIDKGGMLHGAAVHICALSAKQFYFVTKTETQKFQNILEHPQVAVTVANPAEYSTLQAVGMAEVVNDPAVIDMVMSRLTEIYARGTEWLPPISKLQAGTYQIVGVALQKARLANFKDARFGNKQIFKEV